MSNTKIIGITSIKGGVGKTSACSMIAACLTNQNKKVLVIDMDQQMDVTKNSGIDYLNCDTIYDVIQGNCNLMSSIKSTKWFDIIPGHFATTLLDKELIDDRDSIFTLADICEAIIIEQEKMNEKPYDYILFDSHPSKDLLTNMIYVASDYIICPTLADKNSMDGVIAAIKDVEKLRNTRNEESHAYVKYILLNQYNSKTFVCKKAKDDLEKVCENIPGNAKVFTIRSSVRMMETPTIKISLLEYDYNNNVCKDYRKLVKQIVEDTENGK